MDKIINVNGINLLNQISAIIVIIAFLGFIILKIVTNKKVILSELITVIISAGMIPTASILVVFPFKPELITNINDLCLQILFTGLILFFTSINTIISTLEKNKENQKPINRLTKQ